jgi:protein SCO1/2
MRGRLLTVIVAGFLIGALGGAAVLVLTRGPAVPVVATTGTALIGGPFTLVGHDGKPVTDQAFRGKFMLVFFGFTHCPDICPAELQAMSAALDELGPKANDIIPIFITLDPERDTPQAVTDYVRNFGQRFVGLSGSSEQVAAAAKAYRVTYSKFQEKGAKPDDYTIDHSALVYLMSKDGKFLTYFERVTPAAKMAATLKRYL